MLDLIQNLPTTKVSFDTSFTPGWYYIHILISLVFNSTLFTNIIQENPTIFSSESRIYPTLYLSYLTEEKYNILNKFDFFEFTKYDSQIYTKAKFLQENQFTNNYLIKSCPSLDISKFPFKIFKHPNSTIYTAYNVENTNYFDSDPCILSYEQLPNKKLQARYSIGYLQSGEDYLSYDSFNRLVVDRKLQKAGLNGEGQIITILDTGIDTNHDFFYDPNYPDPPIDTTNLNHRKVVRIEPLADGIDYESGHGTHVAGIAAGSSLADDSAASLYNGAAPKSKLYIADFAHGDDPDADIDNNRIIGHMNELDSHIFSNSWGYDNYSFPITIDYDKLCLNNPELLFVFSAGNRFGPSTIYAPADSKNVLTVGMSNSPSISSIRNQRKYIITDGETVIDDIEIVENEELILQNDSPIISFKDVKNETSFYLGPNVEYAEQDSAFNGKKILIYYGNDVPIPYSINMLICKVYSTSSLNKLMDMSDFSFYINSTGIDVAQNNPRNTLSSSQGPGVTGITKPDLVSPGINIMSAKAAINYTGDSSVNVIRSASGTSMAAPMVAGSAALIRQYFTEGRYHSKTMNPSTALIKAVLINSAVKPPSDNSPYLQSYTTGFGTPRLDIGLGLSNDIGLNVLDNQNINSKDHLVYTITTTKVNNLSVTMSYIDRPVNENYVLFTDISIILEAPDGTVYSGNHLENNREDLFTLNEKIVIPNAPIGVYTLHIYSNEFSSLYLDAIHFSLAVTGGFNTEDDALVQQYDSYYIDKCPSSCKYECIKGMCMCPTDKSGYMCQNQVHTIEFNQMAYSKADPRLYRYFKIDRNSFTYVDTFNVTVSMKEGVYAQVCVSQTTNSINDYFCKKFNGSILFGEFEINLTNVFYIFVTPIDQEKQDFNLYVSSFDYPDQDPVYFYDPEDQPTSVVNNLEPENSLSKSSAIIMGCSISGCIIILVLIVFFAYRHYSKKHPQISAEVNYENEESSSEYNENEKEDSKEYSNI